MSKIKKTLITIITTLLIIGIIPMNTLLAEVQPNDAVAKVNIGSDYYFDSIEDAFDYANDCAGSTITLLKDVKISSHLSCNNDYTLDLNGHTIDGQGKTRLINVNAGVGRRHKLTVIDGSLEKTGKLINGKVGQNYGAAFLVQGILDFQSGIIENCSAGWDGGAVSICAGVDPIMPSGIFNMSGGTIRNCSADMGGAVHIENQAKMNMTGGTITNCQAKTKGGAVAIMGEHATFNMSGGVIDSCHADTWGGGVEIYGDTEFHMSGGVIQNCTAPEAAGIMIEEGYTSVQHETPYQHNGGFAELTGGTIQKNHADINGGGVYMHGFDASVFTAQIKSKLTLAGDINIIDNTGPKREDGTNANNLYVGTYPKMDRDTPYFNVEGTLTGKIGLSAFETRKMSYSSRYGNQTSHFFSDYRCWNVLFKSDNCYYLDWGEPDVISAKLVTEGQDNSRATVSIDRNIKRITIYANREIDLKSVFGFETVSIDWVGTSLIERSGDQKYISKTTPTEIKIFHYGLPTNYYYEAFTVAMEPATKYHDWEIYIYGINSSEPQELMAINANVFLKVGSDFEKQEARNVTKNSRGELVYHYSFYPGQRIKLEAYKPQEGQVFDYWDERVRVAEDPEASTTYLTMPQCTVGERALYEDASEYEYLLTVVNGTGTKQGTTEKVSYATPGTQIDIKAIVPDGKILAMWTGEGEFTLTDDQKYNKDFLFTMPNSNATLIANFEVEIKHNYKAYSVIDGKIGKVIASGTNVKQYTPVNIEAETIVGKEFIGWKASDSSLELKQDDYKVSFKMPRSDVELYANYYTNQTGYSLKLINTNKDDDSGTYLHNAKINNVKAEVPNDKVFEKWEFYKYDVLITDDTEIKKIVDDYSTKALGTITMPSYNLTIKAVFKNKYKLTQIGTNTPGETKHINGDIVFIRPETKVGYTFDKWMINDSHVIPNYVEKLGDEENTIKVTMPNQDVKVEATFKHDIEPCKLTKLYTSNDGTELYFPGVNNIVINAIEGESFISWKFFKSGDIEISYYDFKQYIDYDDGNGHLKITMPDFDLKVVAEYEISPNRYLLTKENTKVDGNIELYAGETTGVQIKDDKILDKWIFYKNGVEVDESTLIDYIDYGESQDKSHFTFTMPEANISIIAKYSGEKTPSIYNLKQVGTINEGTSSYIAGTSPIYIQYRAVDDKAFDSWKIYKIDGEIETELTGEALKQFKQDYISGIYYDSGNFNLKMPNYDLKIIAQLKDESLLTPHDLIQIKTIDEGTKRLYKDTKVHIEALDMVGVNFTGFDFYKENVKLVDNDLTQFIAEYVQGDITTGEFTLRMPDYDLKIEACYDNAPSYTYPLMQINTMDAGERSYYQNSKVYIQASVVLGGSFDNWQFYNYQGEEVSPEDLDIVGDISKDNFYLYTPNYGLVVVANFKEDPGATFVLEQIQTTTSGITNLFAGTKVSLKANEVLGGIFDKWKFYNRDSGIELINPMSSLEIEGDLLDEEIRIYMPSFNLKVEATYKEDDVKKQVELTQIYTKNEGSKFYISGTKVLIDALNLVGGTFKDFEFYKYDNDGQEIKIVGEERKQFIKNYVSNATTIDSVSSPFILSMPSYDLKVEATYDSNILPHKLVQINTIDEGTTYHYAGESNLQVEAYEFLKGEFEGFSYYRITDLGDIELTQSEIDDLDIITSNENDNGYIKFKMPNYDLKVVANYQPRQFYCLTQINTKEILPKHSLMILMDDGDRVDVTCPDDFISSFKKWIVIDSDTGEDISSSLGISTSDLQETSLTFTMPARNVTVEATGDTTLYKKLTIVKGYLVDGENNIILPTDIQGEDGNSFIYYEKAGTTLKATFNSDYIRLGKHTFEKWKVNSPSSLTFINPNEGVQVFNMPDSDTNIECRFVESREEMPMLNVINGGALVEGELIPYDVYHESAYMTVKAYDSLGAQFDHWIFYKFVEEPPTALKASPVPAPKTIVREELTDSEMSDLGISKTTSNLTFNMPGYDLEFVAIYKVNQVKLTVIGGYIDDPVEGHIEEKEYPEGYRPAIYANVPNDYSFSHWEIIEGNPTLPEGGLYRGTTVLDIREDTIIKAHFTKKYSPPPTGIK